MYLYVTRPAMMEVDGEPVAGQRAGNQESGGNAGGQPSEAAVPDENSTCEAVDLARYPTLFALDLPVVCKDPYKAMPFVGGAEKVTRAYRGETKKIFVSIFTDRVSHDRDGCFDAAS
jgi:hypothetical protein